MACYPGQPTLALQVPSVMAEGQLEPGESSVRTYSWVVSGDVHVYWSNIEIVLGLYTIMPVGIDRIF